jgi:hypothetical protein
MKIITGEELIKSFKRVFRSTLGATFFSSVTTGFPVENVETLTYLATAFVSSGALAPSIRSAIFPF